MNQRIEIMMKGEEDEEGMLKKLEPCIHVDVERRKRERERKWREQNTSIDSVCTRVRDDENEYTKIGGKGWHE